MIRIAIGLTACSVFALGLGGCAGLNTSTPSTASTRSAAAPAAEPVAAGTYVLDSQRMALLERSARRYGIQLVWVNLPYKKAQTGS